MTAPPGLTYRNGLPGPEHRRALHRLLLDVFDLNVSPVEAFGLTNSTYRAFSYLDETGCCVANAATFTLRLSIGGRRVTATCIQSVATRPEWRHRGLSHDLLERALRRCDAHAQLSFLMTSIPRFYAPMGFRIMPQFAYVGDAPAALPSALHCRRLDLGAIEERRLLVQILRSRIPVSARFAVDGLPGAFLLNLYDRPELSGWYIEARQAIVVTAERSDGTLCIVDIAAAAIPHLRTW